jgi:hypothetical protein
VVEVRPKDFLETEEGLVFAVVSHEIENQRAMCFLRYVPDDSKTTWKKLASEEANLYLHQHHPDYLYHALLYDADLHGVPQNKIKKHYSTVEGLNNLLSLTKKNALQQKLNLLTELFIDNNIPLGHLGITGSLLLGTQNTQSDIDLVIYDENTFHKLRQLIEKLIRQGKLTSLNTEQWLKTYQRRDCSLSLKEYIWHEQRKFNKAIFKDVKFDLSLVLEPLLDAPQYFVKAERIVFTTEIVSDDCAFYTPARFLLAHKEIKELICATPTYTGQAFAGERVEISGILEKTDTNQQRVIVGTSREAQGEYVKVLQKS